MPEAPGDGATVAAAAPARDRSSWPTAVPGRGAVELAGRARMRDRARLRDGSSSMFAGPATAGWSPSTTRVSAAPRSPRWTSSSSARGCGPARRRRWKSSVSSRTWRIPLEVELKEGRPRGSPRWSRRPRRAPELDPLPGHLVPRRTRGRPRSRAKREGPGAAADRARRPRRLQHRDAPGRCARLSGAPTPLARAALLAWCGASRARRASVWTVNDPRRLRQLDGATVRGSRDPPLAAITAEPVVRDLHAEPAPTPASTTE